MMQKTTPSIFASPAAQANHDEANAGAPNRNALGPLQNPVAAKNRCSSQPNSSAPANRTVAMARMRGPAFCAMRSSTSSPWATTIMPHSTVACATVSGLAGASEANTTMPV